MSNVNDEADQRVQIKQQLYKDRRRVQNPERKRHGARNHDKSKLFVRWLAETFPDQLNSGRANDRQGRNESLILDVAGGKGEVAARLCVCHQCQVTLIDPRQCDIAGVFQSTVLRQLPKKYQQRIEERILINPEFVAELFRDMFRQLAMNFDEEAIELSHELDESLRQCSLIIGLHADGATEAIVDSALRHRKPFCVVPCCVFPTFFPQRRLLVDSDDGSVDDHDGSNWIPVRTHEQFCTYLLRKDPRLRHTVLPFEGRNVCIWWDGN
jgi:hypothetical protein